MLNLANVKVTIAPDGSTKFDFSGFEGATCLAEAEALKALLAQYGITTEQVEFQAKPELIAAQLQSKPTAETASPEPSNREVVEE